MKLKYIICLGLGLVLAGCRMQSPEVLPWTAQPSRVEKQTPAVRAVMLLPLSGKSQSVGEAFQNSAMMALQERPSSPMELIFLDTQGTPEGVHEAWQQAREQNPDLIIGPIFAAELQALKQENVSAPVLSFTTNHALLTDGVYSLGILIPDQVDRLVRFMCAAGHKRLAVMGPEDQTAELTMNRLAKTVERCPGMELARVSLYPPETVNFNAAVLKIVPKPIDPKKKDLTEEERLLLDTPMADRLDFDSLFIFEDGVKLQQITSLLAYYDVTPKVVPFYGPAYWQGVRDRSLIGGYYTAAPTAKMTKFLNRYRTIFGTDAPRIASLAYDAVSLTALLAGQGTLTSAELTSPYGFDGINGRFRLNPEGTNERLMAVYQIQNGFKSQVVSAEPTDFSDPDEFFPAPMVIEDETARDGSGETEENRPEMVSDTEDKINSIPVSG